MDNVIVNRIYWQCWSWCYERYQQLENKAILTCATGTKWTSDTSVFSVFRPYVRRQFGVSVVSYQKTTTYFSVYRSAKSKKTPFFKHISLGLWWVSAKTTASVYRKFQSWNSKGNIFVPCLHSCEDRRATNTLIALFLFLKLRNKLVFRFW